MRPPTAAFAAPFETQTRLTQIAQAVMPMGMIADMVCPRIRTAYKFRYVAVLDARTRPEHMAWHGTVLRWDHPWWQTHYPPNGWRCRCTVMQLSEDDLEDDGFTPSDRPPPGSTRPWTNRRTGETVQVPAGIDPGFQHNVGLLGRVAPARQQLAEKIAAAPADLAAPAKVQELDDWIAAGRGERERLVAEAGGVEAPDFVGRFRGRLRDRLRAERGAGKTAADIAAGTGGKTTAAAVKRAAQELPESWVRQGNVLPLRAVRGSRRGRHRRGWGSNPAEITVAKDPGNPLHEYCHHLQVAMPGLDALFHKLHRRRTAGEARVRGGGGGPRERGRKDQYIEDYSGREYGSEETPLEVFTMAAQMLFHPLWGKETLRDLVRDDPEMLDLILGVLFRYDP